LAESGMVFAGKDEKGERMQVCELRGAFPLFFLNTNPLFRFGRFLIIFFPFLR